MRADPQIENKPMSNETPERIDVGFGITLPANANYQPRCPTAIILDTSGSMAGEPIEELSLAIPRLFAELRTDELTSLRVEPCIITCGGDAKVLRNFAPVIEQGDATYTLVAAGETPMGAALQLAMEKVKARRDFYSSQGLASFRPTVLVLSDGKPTDDLWRSVSAELGALARDDQRGWTVIAVGVGPRADLGALASITAPTLPPLRLAGCRFAELFRWLSVSLRSGASRSPSATTAVGLAALPPVSSWASGKPQP